MVYKCCVLDCHWNYTGEERATVSYFPKDEGYVKYGSNS